MTKETRIGLLVALAFIIAFGLVLSELTGTSSPAGRQIKLALSHAKRASWSPVIDRPVPAKIEHVPVGESAVHVAIAAADAAPPALAAREAVVSVHLIASEPAPAAAKRIELSRDAIPGARRYTVQPNDSLQKIARKFYGQGNEGMYTKIFAANRDVLYDETIVLVGQELLIPPLPGRQFQPRTRAPAKARRVLPRVPPPADNASHKVMDTAQLRKMFSAKGKAHQSKATGRIYVVRDGDNLSKIAKRELKDGSHKAVMRLYRANRDRLASPDMLHVGMKLRIPI